MKIGYYFGGLALLFTLASCDVHSTRTVIGYGDPESEEIQVAAFSGVNVTGTFNVDVSIGESQSIVVSAQPQIHEALIYKVSNHVLHLGVKPGFNIHTDEEIKAMIVLPSFDFAGITGKGDFHISGSPQETLNIHISGAGNIEAFDMEVEQCNIHINGVGNCDVNASEFLQVIISGTGLVRYMGNPELESHIQGLGRVEPMD